MSAPRPPFYRRPATLVTFGVGATACLLVLTAMGLSYRSTAHALKAAEEHHLQSLLGLLVSTVEAPLAFDDGEMVKQSILETAPRLPGVMSVTVTTPDGKPVVEWVRSEGPQPVSPDRALGALDITSREKKPLGKLSVSIERDQIEAALGAMKRITLSVLAGTLVIALLMSLLLGRFSVGLEERVARRTEELSRRNAGMRLVLDTVSQGLTTVGKDGTLDVERSLRFREWFGEAARIESLGVDERTQGMLRLGWAQVADGLLPLETSLEQLPRTLERSRRVYALEYRPLEESGGALLVASDVTELQAREREEREQRELVQLLTRIASDRAGALQFMAESERLVKAVIEGQPLPADDAMRVLHTLKGNCLVYGLTSVAEVCHRLEDGLAEGAAVSDLDFASLSAAWAQAKARAEPLFGGNRVELSPDELAELRAAAKAGSIERVSALLEALRLERAELPLSRLAEQARALGKRLGRAPLIIEVSAPGVRVSAERYGRLWSSLVHAVRNAVDHGIETEEERVAAHKPAEAKLALRARYEGKYFVIEIEDDGRGVNWSAMAARAGTTDRSKLVERLLGGGLSTTATVTDISGRGMGMSAMAVEVKALGGEVEVHSEPGSVGTRLTFRFPEAEGARALAS